MNRGESGERSIRKMQHHHNEDRRSQVAGRRSQAPMNHARSKNLPYYVNKENSIGRTRSRYRSSLPSVLLQNQEDVQAFVLTFPDEYCDSVATGCFRYLNDNDQQVVIFCKDRDRGESMVQEAGGKLGEIFGNVVACSKSVKRPNLDEMDPNSAGAKMWHLKEEEWQRRLKDDDTDDSTDSSSSSSASSCLSAPSTKDIWLLEEAVIYYNPKKEMSSGRGGVDSSLQKKLRMAADRSISKSLDVVTLFMLTEYSQTYVQGPNPEWPDYQQTHKLKVDELHMALSAEETALLFGEKLVGPNVQMAMLYTVVAGLPDNHCGNMAVQEVMINDSWCLRIVHFDTGFVSVETGVALESLQLAYCPSKDLVNYEKDFDFSGGAGGKAYYYPILFSSVFSEAANAPLEPSTRQFLLRGIDYKEFDRVVSDCDGFPSGIGKIFQGRWNQMQCYAKDHPVCSCKDLAFNTISAWKRDYVINEKYEVFVDWLEDVKKWATSGA